MIVEAAARLLIEQGYARASTNAIAARAGVSIGSLYQYFEGKDEVFGELVRRHRSEVGALVGAHLQRMADPSVDLVLGVKKLLVELIRLHEREPELMRAIEVELAPLEAAARAEQREAVVVDQVAGLLHVRGWARTQSTRTKAWMMVVVVSEVSRSLVHGSPAGVGRQAVVQSTVAMLEGLLGD